MLAGMRPLYDLRHSSDLVVAWSVADLAGLEVPGRDEVATGLALRSGELVAA
jgi:hypothetical protein